MTISDFQSQFSTSKIIRIFLKKIFIGKYQLRGMSFVIATFWKLQFLKHFITKIMPILRSLNLEHKSTKNIFLWKSAIFHSIKLPFDVEVAEKFLNGIYCTNTTDQANIILKSIWSVTFWKGI